MSCQPFNEMSDVQKQQTALNLATLLLHDCQMEVNKENYEKVLKAAGVNVPSYWFDLMSNAL